MQSLLKDTLPKERDQKSTKCFSITIDILGKTVNGAILFLSPQLTKQLSASLILTSGKLGRLLKQLYLPRARMRGLGFTISRVAASCPENRAPDSNLSPWAHRGVGGEAVALCWWRDYQ